jgi:hypothetical protein
VLAPLSLPPGIFRAGTEYGSRGRWYDASLVRFYANTIQPVGGWVRVNSSALTGRPCALYGWRPNSTASIGRWLAVGTEQKAYVYSGSATTDITPAGFTTGRITAVSTQGYGGGAYGMGKYGTARSSTAGVRPVDAWHFDTWGEYLVGCYTADGRLLEWQLNTANDFAVITNAPTQCRGVLVTSERMLLALGAGGDPRKLQWSTTEDNTTWTPSASNTAGDLLLTTQGGIVTAERVRGGVLVHTTTDAHLMTYIGTPFYYGVDRVGDSCGIVSAHAKVATDSFVVWMGPNGFHTYNGYVTSLPCDVQDYVFGDINRVQISKVCAWHNSEFREIWWFYPSTNASENDRYVVWSYGENHWCIGTLSRTAAQEKGAWDYPICTDASGYWYHHEQGYLNNGAERTSTVYLESGPSELVPGERLVWLNQVIHDESEAADRLSLTIKTKFTPEGTEYTAGPYTLNADNGYTDVRAQGRAYKLRFSELTSGAWKLGTMRLDVKAAGKR